MARLRPLPYDPSLTPLARELRNKSTLAEVLLWQHMGKKQRLGCDFHRQKTVGQYILDFFCRELMLAVEIDGGSHKLKGQDDKTRQRRLEALGIRFLRFKEMDVRQNLDGVLQAIDDWIANRRP